MNIAVDLLGVTLIANPILSRPTPFGKPTQEYLPNCISSCTVTFLKFNVTVTLSPGQITGKNRSK